MGNGDNGKLHSCHFRQTTLQYDSGSSLNGSMDVPLSIIDSKCYKAGDQFLKRWFFGIQLLFWGQRWNLEPMLVNKFLIKPNWERITFWSGKRRFLAMIKAYIREVDIHQTNCSSMGYCWEIWIESEFTLSFKQMDTVVNLPCALLRVSLILLIF